MIYGVLLALIQFLFLVHFKQAPDFWMKVESASSLHHIGMGYVGWYRGVVGELDDELDSNLDLSALRAHPLKAVQH